MRGKVKSSRKKAASGRQAKNKSKEQEATPDFEMAGIDDEVEEDDEVVDWCTFINTFDVCITTYTVLQQDLGVARPPPDRPRRDGVNYANVTRSRSPLIMCEWYRVIMDEVQMVGGGMTE